MVDYRRMVSYMYQYENGVKKKNVGFARIETRGGQCKITLHMQLLGQLDSIFPTYLIQRKNKNLDLIYLGDAILKNQVIDSRLSADENNVMDSGYALTDMGGLLLFLNDKVFFATEWDDKPVVAQEVLEALRPKSEKKNLFREQKNAVGNFREATDTSASNPQEKALKEQLNTPNYMLPGGWKMVERRQDAQNKGSLGRVNHYDTSRQENYLKDKSQPIENRQTEYANDSYRWQPEQYTDNLFEKGQTTVYQVEADQVEAGQVEADQINKELFHSGNKKEKPVDLDQTHANQSMSEQSESQTAAIDQKQTNLNSPGQSNSELFRIGNIATGQTPKGRDGEKPKNTIHNVDNPYVSSHAQEGQNKAKWFIADQIEEVMNEIELEQSKYNEFIRRSENINPADQAGAAEISEAKEQYGSALSEPSDDNWLEIEQITLAHVKEGSAEADRLMDAREKEYGVIPDQVEINEYEVKEEDKKEPAGEEVYINNLEQNLGDQSLEDIPDNVELQSSMNQNNNREQLFRINEPDSKEAKHFLENYPRIYPFEDNEIIQCVKIEPKDIGLLPKELWPFSNNSFLMHGFYCYHHLIFAKINNRNGYRYILGIPGIYHSREQFMARMFGFENFKSIRKRELRQGDFGYWYLPVYL